MGSGMGGTVGSEASGLIAGAVGSECSERWVVRDV